MGRTLFLAACLFSIGSVFAEISPAPKLVSVWAFSPSQGWYRAIGEKIGNRPPRVLTLDANGNIGNYSDPRTLDLVSDSYSKWKGAPDNVRRFVTMHPVRSQPKADPGPASSSVAVVHSPKAQTHSAGVEAPRKHVPPARVEVSRTEIPSEETETPKRDTDAAVVESPKKSVPSETRPVSASVTPPPLVVANANPIESLEVFPTYSHTLLKGTDVPIYVEPLSYQQYDPRLKNYYSTPYGWSVKINGVPSQIQAADFLPSGFRDLISAGDLHFFGKTNPITSGREVKLFTMAISGLFPPYSVASTVDKARDPQLYNRLAAIDNDRYLKYQRLLEHHDGDRHYDFYNSQLVFKVVGTQVCPIAAMETAPDGSRPPQSLVLQLPGGANEYRFGLGPNEFTNRPVEAQLQKHIQATTELKFQQIAANAEQMPCLTPDQLQKDLFFFADGTSFVPNLQPTASNGTVTQATRHGQTAYGKAHW